MDFHPTIVSHEEREQQASLEAEKRDFLARMRMTYTERFLVMTKLMKRSRMLKKAVIRHAKTN